MARIVGGGGPTREASCASGWIAELIHRGDIGAVEEVKSVCDDVDFEPLAEGDALGNAHVPLEEPWGDEGVAAEIADTACTCRGDPRDTEC